MKKYFFQLLFFCLLFLGSFNLGLALQTFDGGGVSIVQSKKGTPCLIVSIPDSYLKTNHSLTTPIVISIYNTNKQLISSFKSFDTMIELPEFLAQGNTYEIILSIGHFNHKATITL